MDFIELATSFASEVEWDEEKKAATPRRFTIRREGRPDVEVEPEWDGTTCVAARFSVDRPGTWGLPPITLRRERALDRRGKRLGINREVQLGDARFDAAVYIVSAAPDTVIREVLARAEARAAVTAVLQGAAGELVIGGGRIAARVEGVHLEDGPALRMIVDYLVFLREVVAVPRDIPVMVARPRRWDATLGAVAALWLGLLGLALLLRPPPVLTWGPVLAALGAGLVLTLLCCGLLVALLRGGPDSLRRTLIAAACFVPVAPIAGARLMLALNATLDGGAAVDRVHAVAAFVPGTSRVTLDVEGLVEGTPRTRVAVPRDRIEGEPTGEPGTMVFVTRPGAFGWPWIEAVAPALAGPAGVHSAADAPAGP